MPRGQKSKHRAREKHRQARAETQGLHDQATTSGAEETTSSSPPDSESGPSSSSAAGTSKGPQGAQGTTSAAAARSRSGIGAEGQVQEGENSSQASAAAESSPTDLLTWKAEMLVQYMLCKYTMRALIKRSEMLKAVTRRYREQFPEILSRASERMELVFGLVLKEVRPNSHCYTLVSNLDLSDSESMRGDWGLPKNGLLMPLLGVIYLNGNHAPEEKIWKFLNMLGIYDGRSHFIFGEPRKLITEDLVQEGYLEYRQVPSSDPPRYEFLWGPKLLTETSKMKVLQFLAKVKDSGHTAFLPQYEEAWREEPGLAVLPQPLLALLLRPSLALLPQPLLALLLRPSLALLPQPLLALLLQPGLAVLPQPLLLLLALLLRPSLALLLQPLLALLLQPGLAVLPQPLLALLLRPSLALLPQPLLALLLQPGLALHPQLLLGLQLWPLRAPGPNPAAHLAPSVV
ncbi:melanoma-associated antigen B2-like [Capricornis sumatraensis]|uniref:melanoma-associated antigen B2-like n=1 Tax=Capricornis sumatraensis TaxID=34865 RepID=UPI003604ECB5